MTDPTPEQTTKAKELIRQLHNLALHDDVVRYEHEWEKAIGRALAAEAQAASAVTHDTIYEIRCELEQPSPSMDTIRECLNHLFCWRKVVISEWEEAIEACERTLRSAPLCQPGASHGCVDMGDAR